MESLQSVMDIVINNILVPILLIVGSAILVLAKSYADKITKSIISKNETDQLKAMSEAANTLLDKINLVVEAAVASNMPLADKLKSEHENEKLTTEDIEMLNQSAVELVYEILPNSIMDENNGILAKSLGGTVDLEKLIESLIEKHVLEQKK